MHIFTTKGLFDMCRCGRHKRYQDPKCCDRCGHVVGEAKCIAHTSECSLREADLAGVGAKR